MSPLRYTGKTGAIGEINLTPADLDTLERVGVLKTDLTEDGDTERIKVAEVIIFFGDPGGDA